MAKDRIRKEVWRELRRVAKPDSRFHWDFSKFIPDFKGSEKCAAAIRGMELYKSSRYIMITPDNCLQKLREYCILDGKTYIMPTYGIVRGFIKISRDLVPQGQEEYASTLDGADRFGISVTLQDIKALGKIDFLVTGASAVNLEGVRYGKGHGYFDLEWAMFREIRVVDENTPVIAVVHDCQVIDIPIEASPYDTIVDIIVTPTKIINIEKKREKPKGIIWKKIPREMIDEIPPLRELMRLKNLEHV